MLQRQDIKDKINTFHLVDQEILAAVPFENPLAKQKDVSLKELVQYLFIYYSEKSGLRPQLDQMFNKANIKPKILIGAVEDHTIIGFVHWNYGVAVVPNLPQLNPNEVKLLHLKDKLACTQFTSSQRAITSCHQQLIALMHSYKNIATKIMLAKTSLSNKSVWEKTNSQM